MAASRNLKTFLDGVHVAKEVFALRPDYRVLLLAVSGIKPSSTNTISEEMLQQAEASVQHQLGQGPVTELPHIAAWRAAYKAFGAKPNKTRNSLEALTRRAEKGLPRVNALTDIYNAISVLYQIPLGGEDLDKYTESPRLIRATGEEDFETTANGQAAVEHPDCGEVVWCDSNFVTCRHWNWRQSPRTALTDNTRNALFIFDALEPVSDDDLLAAAEKLSTALKQLSPDATTEQTIIHASLA